MHLVDMRYLNVKIKQSGIQNSNSKEFFLTNIKYQSHEYSIF